MVLLCVLSFLTFLVAVPSAHLEAVLCTPQKWPNRTVWYEMDPVMATEDRKMIQSAIDDFHKYTCVKWQLHTNTSEHENYRDYLVFTTNANYCYAALGNVGGAQKVILGRRGDGYSCTGQKATVLYFIVHALGFRSEHQRPDRDEYIRMDGCADEERRCYKFDAMPPESVGFPYDICSIMHYKKEFWSNYYERELNIVPLPSLPPSQCLDDELSTIDVKKINKWFDCPESKGLSQALSVPISRGEGNITYNSNTSYPRFPGWPILRRRPRPPIINVGEKSI